MITVYGDILFAVNFFMDFLIIRLSGIICGKASPLRTLAGALLGAIYATAIFFVSIPAVLSFVFQAVIAVAMVAISFGFKTDFRLKLFSFLSVSVFCGGAVLIIFLTGGAFIVNGSVYFSAGIRKLLFSSLGCYYTFKLLGILINKLADRHYSHFHLKITNNGKSVSCVAFCDSGNCLTEPFGGLPVCIVRRNIYNEVCGKADKIYIIPYKTISGESRIMTGFKPEQTIISDISGKSYSAECIVGVTDTELKKGTEAIINPLMLADKKEYEQIEQPV